MFQYAFALSLSKKLDAEIIFDFRYFEEIKQHEELPTREYGLGDFNLICNEAGKEDIAKIIPNKKPENLQKFLWSILKIKKYKPEGNVATPKTAYKYEKEIFSPEDYYYYDGYFQNEKYFIDIRDDILKAFTLKPPIDEKNQEILDIIKNTNSVSLHVRRGDYVTIESANKFHGTCPLKYYRKAIKYIEKHVKNPHFFLLSDDIDWVVKNLKIEHPCTIINFNQEKDYFDMHLMKHCKHNIVANSSFSWWGAWLNDNPKKIVIAPKKWVAKKIRNCDIVPKQWIKL